MLNKQDPQLKKIKGITRNGLKSTGNQRKKLIKELDEVVSKYIRTRDQWKCSRCGVQYPPNDKRIHCSHFWSRKHLGTRWDYDNLTSLCLPCHLYHWEKQKNGDYLAFMVKNFSKEKLDRLSMKANTTTKYSTIDLQLLLNIAKNNLIELQNSQKDIIC